MFYYYILKAEFVTLVSLKVPSGCHKLNHFSVDCSSLKQDSHDVVDPLSQLRVDVLVAGGADGRRRGHPAVSAATAAAAGSAAGLPMVPVVPVVVTPGGRRGGGPVNQRAVAVGVDGGRRKGEGGGGRAGELLVES